MLSGEFDGSDRHYFFQRVMASSSNSGSQGVVYRSRDGVARDPCWRASEPFKFIGWDNFGTVSS